MPTPPKKTYYRIREVVAMLNIPASTLRFWEDTFEQLEPDRTPSGQRRYTPENVEVCKLIKHLLRDKGYSLEYAKRELETYRKCPPRNVYVCKSADDALNLLREVTNMVSGNLHAESRIKAVERWIRSIEIAEEPPRPPHKNIRGAEYFVQEK
ncbi:MerR family transcriptional regulator [uncultured Muribaculum sp.]|uniref:MerR family transcriptional regulator n=1 Tax=uncultured Muribaculum sp. TaxID=1918613 RepID=UPI0025A94383|nr:MerR family transcriptional regulator [uncultured Muribaculum sp.]